MTLRKAVAALRVVDCYYTETPTPPYPCIEFISVSQHLARPGASVTLCGLDTRRGFWERLSGDFGYWRGKAHGWCRTCRERASA